MGTINDLLNEESKTNAVKKIVLLDLDEIQTNPLNTAPIINIEELADAIVENGLQTPITVYKKENHQYVLINGERRYRAMKRLRKTEISAIIMPAPASVIDERLQIMDANAQREETVDYKRQRAKEYEEIFSMLKQENKIPVGLLKIDWIGRHMNISGRQVQRYLQQESIKISQRPKDARLYNDLEECLQRKVQTKVRIHEHYLRIDFTDITDLNRILESLHLKNIVNE